LDVRSPANGQTAGAEFILRLPVSTVASSHRPDEQIPAQSQTEEG